ncbi:ricin-type beta-trefoil lectin domain protein [Micromonospora zingiberis]|nr:ricin-type beta-trefoil lectin domain protein [Micromonospora zingiberis]
MRSVRGLAVVFGATLALSMLGDLPAQAIGGGQPVTGTSHSFIAKIDVAADRSCTGVIVNPHWVLTAADCLTAPGQPPTAGYAPPSTTVTVGRIDLSSSAGQVRTALSVLPHPTRNVTLVRLAQPVTVGELARIGAAAVAGEQLQALGYGRTTTEWFPNRLHSGTFTVASVDTAALTIDGSASGATLCKGDAGGPLVRENGSTIEVVALHDRSWQGGCIGETETRRTAVEARLDDLGNWITSSIATAPNWLADKAMPIMNGARGLCLLATGTTNGSAATTATCSGTAQEQLWTMLRRPDGSFQLKNTRTGRCLYGETTALSGVKQSTCDASTNQQWQINTASVRSQLRNRASNLCVASPSSTPNQVRMDTCGSAQDHHWVQRGNGGGAFGPVKNESNGRCLRPPGGIGYVNYPIRLITCSATSPKWFQSGTTLRTDEVCLTVGGAEPRLPDVYGMGAVTCNGGPDQDWIFLPDGTIKNPVKNVCLNPAYSTLETGFHYANATTCSGQKWIIG